MANISVTKSGNSIIVDFGDYVNSDKIDYSKTSYLLADLVQISLVKDGSHIELKMKDAHIRLRWLLTYDSTYSGTEFFIVDTVEGVSPTSESDLFDKLTSLRN